MPVQIRIHPDSWRDEQVLKYLYEHTSWPQSYRNLAALIDKSLGTVQQNLLLLHEMGLIQKKDLGRGHYVWSLTQEGKKRLRRSDPGYEIL